MRTAIIIGAGLGGIALAARLARAGYDVTVLEKTRSPGGRVALLERDGYRFDMGATLFLMPETFAATYADLGESMSDRLILHRIDPNYRIHFHDGSHLDVTPDMVAMREQMEAMKPGSFQALLRFLAQGYQHYHISLDSFVGRNFCNVFEYFSLKNLPMLFKTHVLQKHAAVTASHFRDPRLLAAFTFQCMYLGLSPYEAPAVYTLLQFTELAEGVWFPRGGIYCVVEDLVAIAEGLGAKFHYDAPVARIDVDGTRAAGVTLESGGRFKADILIANADLPYVYAKLLPDDGTAAKLAAKKYTSSAIMFYWAVKDGRSDALLHHNAFLADNCYRQSFEQIFKEFTLPNEPSFYVNAAARSDPTVAPADGDAITVLVPVGCLHEGHPQNWDELRARARQWVIDRLESIGVQGLRNRIVFEEALTPPDYQRTWNLARSAAFSLSHNLMQVGYLRPHNRHARYRNLYFVGGSTHPGTGLPMVLLSARLVAERIRKEQ
jgi:phytoene desaturase